MMPSKVRNLADDISGALWIALISAFAVGRLVRAAPRVAIQIE
jgi:hypothetical protein